METDPSPETFRPTAVRHALKVTSSASSDHDSISVAVNNPSASPSPGWDTTRAERSGDSSSTNACVARWISPIELDPQFPEGHHIAGYILLGKREYAAAAECLEKAVERSHRGAWPMAKLGLSLVGLGRRDEAKEILEELERRADEATMSFPAVATLHLGQGDHDQFYRWINRGLDARDPFALSLNREYLWDPARHQPEFDTLLRRVGLEA